MVTQDHSRNPFTQVKTLQDKLRFRTEQQRDFLQAIEAANWNNADAILNDVPSNGVSPLGEEVSIHLLRAQVEVLREMQRLRQAHERETKALRQKHKAVEAQHNAGEEKLKSWETLITTMTGYKDKGNDLIRDILALKADFDGIKSTSKTISLSTNPSNLATVEELVKSFVEQPHETNRLKQKLKAVHGELKANHYDQLTQMLFRLVWTQWIEQARVLDGRITLCLQMMSPDAVIYRHEERIASNPIKAAEREISKHFENMQDWANSVDPVVIFVFFDQLMEVLNHWRQFPNADSQYIEQKRARYQSKSTEGLGILSILSDSVQSRRS